ncbi:MAG: class I SAM-dependent methyltransferase, partial [Myxococcota bacterium]
MFHPKGPSFFELAEQALTSTTRGYDLLAPKFEHTPFRTPDAVLGPLAEVIGPDASIEAALDICCGTGAAMAVLRPKCTSHVTGIDLSQGMLEQAQARMDEHPGEADARVLRGDALAMEFDEE